MPSAHELLGIFIAILVIWVVLKLMKVAVKLILFLIGVAVLVWVFYHVLAR